MKKNTITFAIMLITAISFSQEFHIGAKGGVNFATQKGGGNDDYMKARTAFHAGLVGELGLSEKFSLQAELLYSALGYKFEKTQPEYGLTLNEEVKSNYLSLPILAKYYIIKGLSVEAGPQFSFLLSSDYDATISDDFGNSESLSFDFKDDTKSLDFGLALGASYKLDFGLFFGLRYVVGLSKLYDDDTIVLDEDNNITLKPFDNKNQVFQASIGYFFN